MNRMVVFKMLLVIIIFMMFYSQLVWAVDELVLTGTIKSYNKERGIIIVDVKSEGCMGLREFMVLDRVRDELDISLIGQEIEFKIESNMCKEGQVYKMVFE